MTTTGHDVVSTLAVICGASEWPRLAGDFAGSVAFSNTATELRTYLHSGGGMGLPPENLLWLFDGPATATEHLDQIHTFLTHHMRHSEAAHGRGLLVLFVYVGYGDFLGADRAYSLLIRDTHDPIRAETSLRVADIASILRTTIPESARIIILDSCFAGDAFQHFQNDIGQYAYGKVKEALEISRSTRGVALLCAASKHDPVRLADTDTTTLFGRALLDVLSTGDPAHPGALSLRRVCELTQQQLDNFAADDPPRPEVHAPYQRYGDLASVPLFPNPAASGFAQPHPNSTTSLLSAAAPMAEESAEPRSHPAPLLAEPPVQIPSTVPHQTARWRSRRISSHTLVVGLVLLIAVISVIVTTVLTAARPTTHSVIATIAVGEDPHAVAVDPNGNTAYTANVGNNNSNGTVSVIDTASRTVAATIPVGRDSESMTIDPSGRTIYVTNFADNNVSVIDTASRTVVATIPVGNGPTGVAVDPSGHTIYVSNRDDSTVSVIDAASRSVIATIHVGSNPYGVSVAPGGRLAYTANNKDGTVSVIDTAAHIVTDTVPVGPNPISVAIDPSGRTLYTDPGHSVAVIDTASRTVIATIPTLPWPYSAVFEPGGRTAYVTNNVANMVSVIDTATHTVTATVPVGVNPEGIAIDHGGTVYVTNEADNTVSMIQPH